MSNLCIIPARGGSKRIPKKNIRLFLDKPIIAYSIETAIKSKLFDEIMVSTDDDDIAEISLNLGANVPFKRSATNSNDFASTFSVINEVIEYYKKTGKIFDNVCCIYPCAPFVTKTNLIKALEVLLNSSRISVIPVIQFDSPIQRALKVKGGKVQMLFPENTSSRTQDLESAFYDAGQFYWANTQKLLDVKSIFTDNSGYLIIPKSIGQDIDTEEDWKIAEFKYRILNNG